MTGKPFHLTTANDYNLLEAVSALQKEIRRGKEEEAMFWALEVETKFFDFLWVRLVVIANEDIGLADPKVIPLVETLRNQYDFLKKKKKEAEARLPLANAIIAMCRAKKTRLADDFQTVMVLRRDHSGLMLDVPDYALDKHTNRGRSMGRGVKHWREEGVRLSNEVKGMNPYEEKAMEMRASHDRRRSRKGNGHDDPNGELFG
jgi:replication-associated recombination protein RarA